MTTITSIAVIRPFTLMNVVIDLEYDIMTHDYTLSATVWLGEFAIRIGVSPSYE